MYLPIYIHITLSSESGESSCLVDQAVDSPTTVDKESSAGDSLDDIPTLSDLAKQSPKVGPTFSYIGLSK